jgi:hypothetical protein
MNSYSEYTNLIEQIELFRIAFKIVLGLLALVIIRNWYNLYKKRSFRKKNKNLTAQLEASQLGITNFDKELQKIKKLEDTLANKRSEIFQLQQETEDYKKKFFAALSEKDKEIARQKETNNHQQKAYERYVNYKNVEANNTRLGAHFIKNVMTRIYKDLEDAEKGYKSIFGIHYKKGEPQKKILSIKALKNILKLLDYNVSALNKESTTIEDELAHINMFLELINYLKPNAKTELKNSLNSEQRTSIKIKPTLFFPFVENALKHGNLNDDNSFISIDLKKNEQHQLSYCLVNSAEQASETKLTKSATSKFGLHALKQLIDAYYPGSKLEHNNLPNSQYMAQLTLRLNK